MANRAQCFDPCPSCREKKVTFMDRIEYHAELRLAGLDPKQAAPNPPGWMSAMGPWGAIFWWCESCCSGGALGFVGAESLTAQRYSTPST